MDAADPDTFITAVAAVLSCYPEHVVHVVTDPRTGLPGRSKFPPSASEVREACEAEMAPVRRQQEREQRFGRMQADMLALAAPHPETPEHRDAVIVREIAKHGRTFGIEPVRDAGPPRIADMTPDQANAHLDKLAAHYAAKPKIEVGEGLGRYLEGMAEDERAYQASRPRQAESEMAA